MKFLIEEFVNNQRRSMLGNSTNKCQSPALSAHDRKVRVDEFRPYDSRVLFFKTLRAKYLRGEPVHETII